MAKNLKTGEQMYFVALVPPEPLRNELTSQKLYFREKYHSSKALNSPPHVTLHMPFTWKEAKEDRLTDTLSKACTHISPFPLRLAGYGSFPPRVIFVRVEPSPFLSDFQQRIARIMRLELNLFNAEYKDRGFHPHLTLAFRDLKKDQFQLAWEEFSSKEYYAEFSVTSVFLLKHDGKSWQLFHEELLKG